MLDNEQNSELPPKEEKLSPIASMEELTAQEEFPKPDEEAIEAIKRQAETQAQPAAVNKPDVFDPSIHAVGKDGQPSITSTGKFRMKKGAKFNRPQEKPPEVDKAQELFDKQNYDDAVFTSAMLEQLQIVLISDDFTYIDIERQSNVDAWKKTYEYYGGSRLSPPIRLAMNHAAIIIARSQKPKVQTRFALMGTWLKSKFKRRNKNGAYSGSRNDGSGQNNVGAEKSVGAAKT